MAGKTDHVLSSLERHDDLLIPVNDVTVAATRYEPKTAGEENPVVLMAVPYRKDDRITFGRYDPTLQYIANAGYEVISVDLPGTGASSGEKPHGFSHEGKTLREVIRWLADQEWSTGHVGMFGKSYGGLTQLHAASVRPDALETIVPIAISDSAFDGAYPGGAFNTLRRPSWDTGRLAELALPPSRRDGDGRWAEVWHDRLDRLETHRPWLFDWLDHPTLDSFWKEQEVAIEEIDVPVFAVCGFRDTRHVAAVTEYFARLDTPKRLLLGPWRHILPIRGRESAINFRQQIVEWYDYHLKGDDNEAMDHSPIEFWTERDGGWKVGGGVWRRTDHWPTSDSDDSLVYSMSPDGLVPESEYRSGTVAEVHEVDATVGPDSIQRLGGLATKDLDTAEGDSRSLVFETAPLQNWIEFTGTGHVVLQLTPTSADPLVVVRVNDRHPDGNSTPVTSGILRPMYRNRQTEPTPLEPGTDYELRIPLVPRSHVFEQGHRIRISISGSMFPQVFTSPDSESFTVRSSPEAPSKLIFPGTTHSRDPVFGDSIEMASPDESVTPIVTPFVQATWEPGQKTQGGFSVTRDPETDSLALDARETLSIDLPHGPEMHVSQSTVAKSIADEPGSETIENTSEYALDYGTETVRSRASSFLTQEYSVVSLKVTADDHTVFERNWRHQRRLYGL